MYHTSMLAISVMYIVGILFSSFIAMNLLKKRDKSRKGINKKTYAKITKVERRNRTDWDFEQRMEITVTYYWLTYEFIVDGVCYTGHGSSKWKKKVGKRIKIFYDEKTPQKTLTAEFRNEVPRVLVIIAVIAVGMFYLLDKIS